MGPLPTLSNFGWPGMSLNQRQGLSPGESPSVPHLQSREGTLHRVAPEGQAVAESPRHGPVSGGQGGGRCPPGLPGPLKKLLELRNSYCHHPS